jgi:hypothetical protein
LRAEDAVRPSLAEMLGDEIPQRREDDPVHYDAACCGKTSSKREPRGSAGLYRMSPP